MSKQEQASVTTTELEKPKEQEIPQWMLQLARQDKELLKDVFSVLSMMVNAFEGRPIEPEDVITRLINVKNIVERSRFPTYPLLAKQVYLRLIAKYNPQAYPCKDWANLEAEALVSYKGLNWDAYVEMAKARQAPGEQQQFYFGAMPQAKAEVPQPKRRFWQHKPKGEPSEFESE